MENGTAEKTEGQATQEPARMDGEPKYLFKDPRNGDAVCFDQANHMLWFGVKVFPNTRPWELIKDTIIGLTARAWFVWQQYVISVQENSEIQRKLEAGQKLNEQEKAKALNKGFIHSILKH